MTKEVSRLHLGEIAIGLLPGEPFVEFQLRFKEALAPRPALLLGYANGWAGYVPPEACYEQGGYGVDPAPRDPPPYCRTMAPPGLGERMLATLLELALVCKTRKRG